MKHHHGVVDLPAKRLENEHMDPVCGMTVQADKAAETYDYEGQRYYFCSNSCLEKFKRSPETYLPKPERQVQRDPVCGMDVDPEKAAGVENFQGRMYYFCSTSCQQKFRAEPAKYLGQTGAPPTPPAGGANVEYTCPMDPEVRQLGPGNCPKCGMALEPAVPTAPVSRVEVHVPDAPGDHPGRAGQLPDLRYGIGTSGSHG